jgi:hypothetical protein
MAGARTRGASPDVKNNPTSLRSLTGAPFSGTRPQIPHSMSTSSWPSATVRSCNGPRPITTLPLAKGNSGNENLRLETQGATRRELSSRSGRQTAETFARRVGYGNLAPIPTLANHARLRRLPGGAEGIRTDGHCARGEISSYSAVRPSMQSLLAAGAFSIAINALARALLSPAAPEGQRDRPARQAAGRILWFTWNKLAGSYFFFNAARRW